MERSEKKLDETPVQAIKNLIARYDLEILEDNRRLENMLMDLCGACQREIFVLTSVIRENIPRQLLENGKNIESKALYFVELVQEKLMLSRQAACWAIASWTNILGIRMAGANKQLIKKLA